MFSYVNIVKTRLYVPTTFKETAVDILICCTTPWPQACFEKAVKQQRNTHIALTSSKTHKSMRLPMKPEGRVSTK